MPVLPTKTKFQILFVGEQGTGKTALFKYLCRLEDDKSKVIEYPSVHSSFLTTLGMDLAVMKFEFGNEVYRCALFDGGGHRHYQETVKNYYGTSDVVLLHFDLTDKDTFSCLEKRLKDINRAKKEEAKIILIGTKRDVIDEAPSKREVMEVEIDHFVRENELLKYIEVNAKDTGSVRHELIPTLHEIISDFVRVEKNNNKDKIVLEKGYIPFYTPVTKTVLFDDQKEYEKIWKPEKKEAIKDKMIRLLSDYAKGDSTLALWCHFHANRNRTNTKAVSKIVKGLKTDVINIKQAYEELTRLTIKENGSLHRHLAFLKEKLLPLFDQGNLPAAPDLKKCNWRMMPVLA